MLPVLRDVSFVEGGTLNLEKCLDLNCHISMSPIDKLNDTGIFVYFLGTLHVFKVTTCIEGCI